ncbi:hypothetical protein AWC38_SpisGene15343 [Paramuricea clavata]|uniref:Uncharacterized protein n=1 Tax=Paramuricea clavata TaxID=317549 RepID=A0A7D9IV72_PARCT|nr:hypothetical protein AWC38_SpisGene15343 [Paramuricea clavata]
MFFKRKTCAYESKGIGRPVCHDAHGISQNYLLELDDDDEIRQAIEWFDIHDEEVFTFKQSIVDYLHEAKGHLKEEFSRSSVKSKYSQSSRSYASGSSNRSQLIQAKAKTASLEAKAAFFKESQALEMAAEELELKRMIAQAKAEEKPTAINYKHAESLSTKTPSIPKPVTTSTSKKENLSKINPEALPFVFKQDKRTEPQSPIERLYFLDQYTTGKAKEVIKGCIQIKQMKSNDSYGQAKALLKKHFGDPFKLAFTDGHLVSFAMPEMDSVYKGLLLHWIQQAKNTTTGLPYRDDLNTAQVSRQLWEKLPLYLRSKWTERASRIRSTQSRNATFSEFSKFVTEQAELAIDPVFSEEFSEKPHDLNECEEIGKKTLPQRKDLIREKGLCFGCLKPGHISSKCNDKLVCKTCEKKHPSALHDPFWKPKSNKLQTTPKENVEKNEQEKINSGLTACSIIGAVDVPVNMGIVPVWLHYKSEPKKRIKVYALLDNGSGGTFIKTETMERLGIDCEDTALVLTTMHRTQEIETKVVNGLVAANCQKEDVHLDLPKSYAREQIPTDREEITRPEVAERFHHLQKISEPLTPYIEDVEVSLLIGLNCPKT